MIDQGPTSAIDAPPVVRDEDGALREDFVERVAQAVAAADPAALRSSSATCTRPTSAT